MAFAATIVTVLAATGVWNPFPRLWEWVNRSEPIATPATAWQQRLGGTPTSATIAGGAVVVEHRTTVEARGLATGARLWQRDADWGAVAGEGAGSVVVTGELLVKGYDVVDPTTGAVRRHDGQAVAVWTFRDALLDVRCAGAQDCTLTAWDPRGASPLWRAQLPGVGFVLFADNPDVLGTRPLTVSRVESGAAGPLRMPQLIGFPIDGRVHVVDTASGRVLQELEPRRRDRVIVAGGRVLRTVADARDGSCYFTVVATDGVTGQEVWREAGLNLRTVDGSGCVQRNDPGGQDSVVVAVEPDGREVLLDAYDGRRLWAGGAGQHVEAVDSLHALVRSPDRRAVSAVALGARGARWTRPVDPDAQTALVRYAAVVSDREPDRIIAVDPATGRVLLNVRSSAKVAAAGPGGLILVDRREMGYAPFAGAAAGGSAGRPESGAGPGPGGDQGDPGCGGPKREECPAGRKPE
ncbi:MAG TPA: PQQ-binding-like beta-propeller repeat protein [Pilimelia sp.]|nr:PQQ-binding-like beta-propeller repeat protein [Pilimelia sp.]